MIKPLVSIADYYDDVELNKLLDSESTVDAASRIVREIVQKEENEFLRYMFRIGDFDPRHYKLTELEHTHHVADSSCRIDTEFKIEYIATDRQKKTAARRLRQMYGTKSDLLIPKLHPLSMALSDMDITESLYR